MRQIMPHRNNIHLRRTKCKIFLMGIDEMPDSAMFLQQFNTKLMARVEKNFMSNNGLRMFRLRIGQSCPTNRHG
jgi:hypothetical protein